MRTTQRKVGMPLMLIALTQLISCSSLSSADKSLYALDAGQPTTRPGDAAAAVRAAFAVPTSVARDQVLQVRQVDIAAPFDGLSLVYRVPGGTFVKDYYNQWVAPPAELFSGQLVDYLSGSGAFASVVDGHSAAPHRFALETSITGLYGDFQDQQHPKVVLSARVYLLDDAAAAGGRRVVHQGRYDLAVPLAGASAREMVAGAGRAYRQMLESVAKDVSPFNQSDGAAGY